MPARFYDARHRVRPTATTKPRRLIAGLALPTTAAVALMFTATGAAVATSPRTQSVSPALAAATWTAPQPAVVDSSVLRARHLETIEKAQAVVRHEQGVARAAAAVRVARSATRKKLAARALASKVAAKVAAKIAAKVAAEAHNWQLPLTNPVQTSGFGYRWGRLHAGEDYAASIGTNLVSMSTGTVVLASAQSGYGNMVQIRYWDGTVSYYAHMSGISVSVGQAVGPGESVGQSGNTGGSTGPHLHLEIHPGGGEAVDPLPWLASHSVRS